MEPWMGRPSIPMMGWDGMARIKRGGRRGEEIVCMSGNGTTGASAIRARKSYRTSIFNIILLEKDMEKGLETEKEEGRGRGRNVSVSLVSTLSLSLFCLKSTFIFLSTHVQEGGRRGRGTKSSVHQGGQQAEVSLHRGTISNQH